MKRQRIITQMREKGKTPENQLSDEETLSLQEKDFRLLMLKMMQDIGSKALRNIQQLPFSGGGHVGNIWPHPSVSLRSPRAKNNPGGITAPPLGKQAP